MNFFLFLEILVLVFLFTQMICLFIINWLMMWWFWWNLWWIFCNILSVSEMLVYFWCIWVLKILILFLLFLNSFSIFWLWQYVLDIWLVICEICIFLIWDRDFFLEIFCKLAWHVFHALSLFLKISIYCLNM